MGSTPGSGRSPGVWHGNPLQYSCLRIPMDRGAQRAPEGLHRVAESTGLEGLRTHACSMPCGESAMRRVKQCEGD